MSVLPSRRHVGQQIAAVGLDEDFRRGFIQMIPLWPGVVAFSIAYAIAARTAGFGPFEIVAMSALIFAGSAQVAAVALYASGAGFIPIVLTGLLLNVRHIFYGLSINRWLPERTTPPKPVLAFFLTDESYGVSLRSFVAGRVSSLFLLGVSISLWIIYIPATAFGALVGDALPATERIGLEFIFPLTFVALLMPMLKTRVDVAVAIIAAALMFAIDGVVPDGASIVLVIALAATAASCSTALTGGPG
ncbi:MAG: AzlC family ABC transporter permease [Thermomicrobiales bacterium]